MRCLTFFEFSFLDLPHDPHLLEIYLFCFSSMILMMVLEPFVLLMILIVVCFVLFHPRWALCLFKDLNSFDLFLPIVLLTFQCVPQHSHDVFGCCLFSFDIELIDQYDLIEHIHPQDYEKAVHPRLSESREPLEVY